MSAAEIKCLRCDGKMEYSKELNLRADNNIMNAIAGNIAFQFKTKMYVCSKCGKIELYDPKKG